MEKKSRQPDSPKIYEYYATTVGGMEDIAAADLRHQLQEVRIRIEKGRRHGRLFFHYERSPRKLLELRSVDNVFVFLTRIHQVTTGQPGLHQIVEGVSQVDLKPAMALHDTLHGPKSEPVCKLVCTVGGRHRFSARDLYRAVRDRLGADYTIEEEPRGNAYPLLLQVMDKRALWGMQLPRRRLRDRLYRQAHVPGGLEGTVAYCMALLAGPERQKVWVDPMCGGATTLIEAGLAFAPQLLVGGDLSTGALAAARENSDAADQKLNLLQWDVEQLPLANASIDALVCNLPYEKKATYVRQGDNSSIIEEFARVLRPGKRAVFLTADKETMDMVLEDPDTPFELHQRLTLHLRGVDPSLYVLERKPASR